MRRDPLASPGDPSYTRAAPSVDDRLSAPPRRRWLAAALVSAALAVLGAAGALAWIYRPAPPGTASLAAELRDRGRVALVGDDDLLRVRADGAQLIAARDIEGLEEALAGTDEAELDRVLREAGVAGVLVDGRRPPRARREGATLAERLRAYDRFEVLSGVYLTPVAALYVRRREQPLSPAMGDALARAARQIVGGSSLPRVRAFPEALHRSRNVEVLVLLRKNGQPQLWRSARGGSIARALITAASVARERWAGRETAMGGPIEQQLPSLAVEVYLLEEDGTLGDRSAAFLERAFTPEHGVAFEERGSWHYLLPVATRQRGGGSIVRAYRALLEDADLPPDSLETRDLRLYRLVARRVGISAPPASGSARAPSPARSLGELLDAPELDSL